ncbi:hypothetical protein DFH06DRAFT_1352767 [Mycena polygramma]|nr:hypothetical protein DFH06DRAFT_1352767 [Mycena polygramma]
MPDHDLRDSARVYSDEQFAALIATLHVSDNPSTPSSPSPPGYQTGSTTRPTAHPRTPTTPTTPTTSRAGRGRYFFQSPTKRGYTDSWATAGAATQGVAGAHVHSVQKSKKKKGKSNAYAVFCGRKPGTFDSWAEAEKSTKGASGAIYRGYPNDTDATAAFEYAAARSWTRVCTSRPASPSQAPVASLPLPCEESDYTYNPLHGSETVDDTWYVVYCGITPGVYHSLLEALLNTVGIRNQRYESVIGREEAFKRYRDALEERETESASPPSYEA